MLRIGKHLIDPPFLLAPMASVSEMPFRVLVFDDDQRVRRARLCGDGASRLLLIALSWAFSAWRDDPPKDRQYFWLHPVGRTSHTIARSVAAGLWLLVVVAVIMGVVLVSVLITQGGDAVGDGQLDHDVTDRGPEMEVLVGVEVRELATLAVWNSRRSGSSRTQSGSAIPTSAGSYA